MAGISKLKCVDPKGYPQLDENGEPMEPALMHASIPYRFKAGEELFIDADIAAWLAQKSGGRLLASPSVTTVEAVVIDGNVFLVDKVTRMPISVDKVDPSKLQASRSAGPGAGTRKADGTVVAPHPPEGIEDRLNALAKA